LFLLPSEQGFLQFLAAAKVPLNKFEIKPEMIANVQDQVSGRLWLISKEETFY